MVHTLASIVHKLEITFMFDANYQSVPVSKDFEIKKWSHKFHFY